MPEDFEVFYARVKDGCLRAMTLSTGNRELAEDLVAEALARAWARWPAVSMHPCPEAWVMRTALNLNISWWRRRQHERRSAPPPRDDRAALQADPLGRHDIVAAVQRLSERQRQVVALRIYLDLDTAATAKALGIAEGTVSAHLARAIAAMRDRLTQRCSTGASS
jgi:RNA polymerase sigma-70 factor (ECF subfamily)